MLLPTNTTTGHSSSINSLHLMGFLSPSLLRSSLLSNLSKSLTLTLPRRLPPLRRPPIVAARSHSSSSLSPSPSTTTTKKKTSTTTTTSKPPKSKHRRDAPENVLRHNLDMCSKHNDLTEALRLYDEARSLSIPISLHGYNVLFYLCSSQPISDDKEPISDDKGATSGPVETSKCDNTLEMRLERGFEIYRRMRIDGVEPNEATFTNLARLAASKNDPDLAFQLIKEMKSVGIDPKLRSYGPALFGFCEEGRPEMAYAVEKHMEECEVAPEDAELAALIGVSSGAGKGKEVYRLLQKLRATVRQVSEDTASVVERWFTTEAAARVGVEKWDAKKVRKGVLSGGGGWHGQGWLGKGKWSVGRTGVDDNGVCRRCGEKLVCIDIDPLETKNFARMMADLACQKEARADFQRFQAWLNRHGPYDAVIDGANVGLFKQTNFSFYQINSVINGIREMSPSKKEPLVILHSRRTKGGSADNPRNKKMIERWRNSGALYATPYGSNDDWYWLYAAVSCKSLLVTNDEMRDHLFQLLGNSFFPRWKEKHQVRLTFSRRGPSFHLPPPYSIVTQESETGNWHIPTVVGDDIEMPRQWVCASRTKARSSSSLLGDAPDIACHTSVNNSMAMETEAGRLSSLF